MGIVKYFPKKYAQLMIGIGYTYNNLATTKNINKNTKKSN